MFCAQQASALGLFNCSVRWILHDDHHCHPYKRAIVQDLSEREEQAPHLMFHSLLSKVFLSSNLRTSHLMFHYLSSKAFLSSNLRASHLMFHYISSKNFLSSSLQASHLMFYYLFGKGFSELQSTASTLDISLTFVVKHDLKSNIREEIANIPTDTLVRVMANIRNRCIQCMDGQ